VTVEGWGKEKFAKGVDFRSKKWSRRKRRGRGKGKAAGKILIDFCALEPRV